jgi:cytosine/adenosine deaminase-related metal-dependent hydrolase
MEWAIGPSAVKAYDLLGLRVVNILTLTDVTSWTPPDAVLTNDQYFELSDELIDCCRRSRRSEFAYGVACPNSCTESLMRRRAGRGGQE